MRMGEMANGFACGSADFVGNGFSGAAESETTRDGNG